MTTIRKISGKNPFAGLFPKKLSPEAAAVTKKLSITNRLLEVMLQKEISRTELAARMGIQPSRVTAMLSGTSNLTIDTLVRAGFAIGMDLHQTYAPQGHRVVWRSYEPFVCGEGDTVTLNVPFRFKPPAGRSEDDYVETSTPKSDFVPDLIENVA